jgi:uncharacterized protein YbjT (DUF2867 family)
MILMAAANRWRRQALLLALAGRPVRAFVDSEYDAVLLREQGIEAVAGALLEGRGLDTAMRGVRTLVYVDHMMDHGGDPVANELGAM